VNRPAEAVFQYPSLPHERSHGPRGYSDFKHYKPWLRDEFSFRCVYCLCRETWFPDGEAFFGIDHVIPQSLAQEGQSVYEDLVYACCVCNAWKKDFPELIDFGSVALASHLEVQSDGKVQALSPLGEALIDVCALNRPTLLAFRRDLRALLGLLARHRGGEAARLWKRYLGYPDDLPDLAILRPPAGNSRPEGISACSFKLRRRGSYQTFIEATPQPSTCGQGRDENESSV
jgi:HNH endonuclease